MAYKTCGDCGTKLWGNKCPNCHEELIIIEEQSEFIDFPLSEDFLEKARHQREQIESSELE